VAVWRCGGVAACEYYFSFSPLPPLYVKQDATTLANQGNLTPVFGTFLKKHQKTG
jgi:hypothetical protein